MYCSHCGKSINDDSEYCRHCGSKISQGTKGVTKSEGIHSIKTENNKIKYAVNRRPTFTPFKLIITVFILSVIGFLYYHIFIETLRFSDLVGNTDNFMEAFVINVIDFDTNLTRWDVYRLKSKTKEWKKREYKINSIQDPYRRKIEREKLMTEMQQDPSFRKVIQKAYGIGAGGLKTTLEAFSNFMLLGIF